MLPLRAASQHTPSTRVIRDAYLWQGDRKISVVGMRERLNKARQRASSAYREAKSLMSSEMEGVVLKATRPDDLPVKPKHLESLMRPTIEMPKEFNVYLPVVSGARIRKRCLEVYSERRQVGGGGSLFFLRRFVYTFGEVSYDLVKIGAVFIGCDLVKHITLRLSRSLFFSSGLV